MPHQLDDLAGPLTVSAANPRYFTAASGTPADRRAVYLTGSHIWNNLHDGMGPGRGCAETPERFDYDAYLDFLVEHGHNFIRLWRWEQFRSQPPAATSTCAWVIDTVRRHERELGSDRHPIGMTMQFPVPAQTKVNQPLLDSRAEWTSPGYDDEVFAERMRLIEMDPRDGLSSTGYVLADPGQEYLVLQPTAGPFTVTLAAGTYTVEWFGVDSRQTTQAGEVTLDHDQRLGFTPPFAEPEPAVLYLARTS